MALLSFLPHAIFDVTYAETMDDKNHKQHNNLGRILSAIEATRFSSEACALPRLRSLPHLKRLRPEVKEIYRGRTLCLSLAYCAVIQAKLRLDTDKSVRPVSLAK